MKEIILLVISAALALNPITNGSIVIPDTAVEGNHAQIANPFTDCDTLEEAAQTAGFPLSAPDSISGGFSERVIRAVKDTMIEVIYYNETDKICIRKATGSEDISGVYTKFDETTSVQVNKLEVTLKGNNGKITTALWTYDGYTYAITATSDGMDKESVIRLIKEI